MLIIPRLMKSMDPDTQKVTYVEDNIIKKVIAFVASVLSPSAW